MSNILGNNILRFLGLILIQVLVLNHINLGGFITPYLYILFVLMLPTGLGRIAMLMLSFLSGLCVDIFSNMPGLHCATATLIAFLRITFADRILKRDSNQEIDVPSIQSVGFRPFAFYSFLLIFIYHLVYALRELFSFHGLLNMRAPRYRDYKFEPVFSDGYSETYDFSDRKVTGISSVEIELEPSYIIDKWRLWASARYYSRQYINRTNTLYFNPRWETFGGVDFSMNRNVSFGVSVINFLNQKGASAGIQAASLATDATPFKNYLTSGTYIRPFTVEFSTRISF